MKDNCSKKVFICNSADQVRKFIRLSESAKAFYLTLDYSCSDAEDFLVSVEAKNLTKELFSNSIAFRAKYVHFMRNLNKENSSLEWWAMNFTNKNPLLTNLYNDVFYIYSLANFIQKTDFKYLFVFSSNPIVARKLKSLGNELGIDVYCAITHKFNWKDFFANSLPIMIFYSAIKVLFRKLLSVVLKKGSQCSDLEKNLYLIATAFANGSFKNSGFKDSYFGPLREFLLSKGIGVMTVGFVSCKFKNLFLNKEPDVFIFEKFVKFSDILKWLLRSLEIFFSGPKAKGMLSLSGIDLTDFIKNEIKLSVNSGQMFLNLIVYSSTVGLMRKQYLRKVFYPFENRSWEKMIILAVRGVSKNVKLVGYQHASLTPKHTNLCLETDEYKEIPFPDEIITMGYITRDIMVNLLNFPRDRLKIGCALRQTLAKDKITKKWQGKINRILVALASSVDEYQKVLEFLDSAFSSSESHKLIIRPHPLIDFKKALNLYKPRNIKYELDKGSLQESLKACDLVIYVSSTVSLEAISMGIPVICLALDDILSPDPLFNASFLKRDCKDPGELRNLIKEILRIDKAAQEKAEEFGRLYCVPASENSMEVFI